MKILKKIIVPTGEIYIGQGSLGPIEFLSLADYGKDVNLNQNKPVVHQRLMPLTKKWVATLSTQFGCSSGCRFCEVPKVGTGRNASLQDLKDQLHIVMSQHPEITKTERLNIHFARMGEPTWNGAVLGAAIYFYNAFNYRFNIHPVVSTMMPRKNVFLASFLYEWMEIKNHLYQGNAGLQISVNSTDEDERHEMFSGSALTLGEIAEITKYFDPVGRKITLNFAVAGYQINPEVLLRYFNPSKFLVKLTPMHKTSQAVKNGIATVGDYTTPEPYQVHAEELRAAGYDVLVFIASKEEDESRITCGNAILSDRTRGII